MSSAFSREVGQQRAQIVEIEQQAFVLAFLDPVVGDAERDGQRAFLRVGRFQHAAHQHRAHFGDGGAHRVAEFAIDVPEHGRRRFGRRAAC